MSSEKRHSMNSSSSSGSPDRRASRRASLSMSFFMDSGYGVDTGTASTGQSKLAGLLSADLLARVSLASNFLSSRFDDV